MLSFDIEPQIGHEQYVPMMIYNRQSPDFPMLIDTGASIPVWVAGKGAFEAMFPAAKDIQAQVTLHGFGDSLDAKGESAELYIIPFFDLTDNNEHIIYKNLLVALKSMDADFKLILSFTMFRRLHYQYDGVTDPIHPIFTVKYNNRHIDSECIIDKVSLYKEVSVYTQFNHDIYDSKEPHSDSLQPTRLFPEST